MLPDDLSVKIPVYRSCINKSVGSKMLIYRPLTQPGTLGTGFLGLYIAEKKSWGSIWGKNMLYVLVWHIYFWNIRFGMPSGVPQKNNFHCPKLSTHSHATWDSGYFNPKLDKQGFKKIIFWKSSSKGNNLSIFRVLVTKTFFWLYLFCWTTPRKLQKV
jgi:hypothetical protein